jgi:Cu/Ag efflux protein CusF
MRKLMLGAVLAAYLAGSAAFAAEIKATITHIDVNARIIVIDGRAFHVGTNIDIAVFKVGQMVTVVFETVDGQLKIVSIKVD